jgi:hypothetical protein
MRSFEHVIALRSESSVESREPCRIKHSAVNMAAVAVVFASQPGKQSFDQSAVVRRQVDSIEQMKAIAAVSHDWLWPAAQTKHDSNPFGFPFRQCFLSIGRADSAWPIWVNVDQEPATC